jgi:hypothetical protein
VWLAVALAVATSAGCGGPTPRWFRRRGPVESWRSRVRRRLKQCRSTGATCRSASACPLRPTASRRSCRVRLRQAIGSLWVRRAYPVEALDSGGRCDDARRGEPGHPRRLATIPPQRASGARSRDLVAGLIPGFDDKVRALAVSHNAVLVDVYIGMKDDLSLIGVDALHPTARGYEAMASIYCDAIAKRSRRRRAPMARRPIPRSPRRERSDRTERTGSAGALARPRRHPAT